MLISDIQWKPIRLEIQRKSNYKFSVFRDGEYRGLVYLTKEGWRISFHYDKQHSVSPPTSFRVAILRLTRRPISDSCDRIQDFGPMHVRRTCVDGLWFTALIPKIGTPHLFLDYNDKLTNPNDHMQSILKRVVLDLKLDK